MITINASDYIQTGFDKIDADTITYKVLSTIRESNDNIEIDFKEVRYYTTHFFDRWFDLILNEYSFATYVNRIKIVNLSDIGQHIYNICYDNVKSYLHYD